MKHILSSHSNEYKYLQKNRQKKNNFIAVVIYVYIYINY